MIIKNCKHKRQQEYTEELYKNDLHDSDNHSGVIIHLQPDTLKCEVKWALGSITTNKASGGDGIPVELVQIMKDDAVKVLHLLCQQIWKTQQWPQDWKRSGFIPIPKKGKAKECSNYCTIVENLMDRGAWQATAHGVAESYITEQLHFFTSYAQLRSSNMLVK